MRDFGVIFDMDGVLVDSNEAHFETFQKMGRELGVSFPAELWKRTIGMHNKEIFPLWLGADLSPERARELAARKEAMYRELAETRLKAVPGVVALIEALHAAGFRLAVGSSGPRENVALAIRKLEIAPYLRAVVTGDDVTHGKPHPEIFLTAASRIELAPDRCLVIEDAPQGIRAARAAGMRVVGITTSREAEHLAEATRIISSFEELAVAGVAELLKAE